MDHGQVKIMKAVLLVASLASFGVLAVAAYRENFEGSWRDAQRVYRDALIRAASTESARRAAASFAVAHKQTYLPELGAIDRCTSCHLGVENPAMVDAAPPLATHSGDLLANHPVDRFGCTVCHGGRGRATRKEEAHGWRDDGEPYPHVDTPLLRGRAVYTSCGRCHSEIDLYGGAADLFAGSSESASGEIVRHAIDETGLQRTLPGAEWMSEAKRLVVQSGCLGCHKYRGRGGLLGPELTYVGDKTRHDFDFSHVRGEHTVEQWLLEHFMFPTQVSPTTVMPEMGLSEGEARTLALYMMSLHRKSAPASHIPTPATVAAESAQPVRGETLFGMFCASCHGADGRGTTMRTGLWPRDADPWGHQWDARDVMVEKRGTMDVMVPSLNHPDTLAVMSDDYLHRIVAEGRPGTPMLAWSREGGLKDDEIALLVDYIRAWQAPVPDLGAVSASRGDARIGGALYRANCATCHGAGGEGGIGNSLNAPTFLGVASDAFLRDTIVGGRPDTAMPAWREFNAQELSDLLAFMRRWQAGRSDPIGAMALVASDASGAVSAQIGRTLFKANCVMCHGVDGEGDLGPSLSTQAFLTVVPDTYLVETIIEGRPGTGMPSWRHLSNEDVASIVRHLRTWQRAPSQSAEWHAQHVPRGDWDAGRSLFAGNCASCHGADGEGAVGPQLNNAVFLRHASDVMLREWITHGKEGTPMRGFRKGGQGIAELTDRQIEDVVAYVRLFERMGDDEIVRAAKAPHGRPENGVGLYAIHCSGCHGDRGQGASGPALSNPGFLRSASDGFLMATMALGRRGTEMRPVKKSPQSILGLTSDEVNDIVAYLRSWEWNPPFDGSEAGGVAHRFVVPWNFARGQAMYQSNCAGCHGDEGRGSWAPELNNEGFLSAATDGALQATIVRGRKGTAMRPFGRGAQGLGELRSDDVDDIVAYMRSWSSQTPSPMTIPAQRSLMLPLESQHTFRPRRDGESTTAARPPTQEPSKHQPSVAAAMPSARGD